ncbi:peptidylprolyl isomerase [Luteolibacter ambystomatis]|uniref:Peptidylprolyl isomerase n=1 Tax=Luteolibacter ambystomatis TaxID=2824561 RepID=A0A975J049_9BACT|nr:peptidylprolyl isomerase [Luteolibacter ambystomatis]QUE51571.1 peptidylprolyl isomerase [Luteolibacter ambystomatis]
MKAVSPYLVSMMAGLWALGLSDAGLLAAETASKSGEGVVARIGDTEVGEQDIRAALDGLDERERATVAKDPALLNQVVRSMLIQRLVLKQAANEKWEQKPEIAAQLERSRRSTITESYLKSQAEKSGAVPSETELRQAYDGAKDSLFVPKQFQLAQIFIAIPQEGGEDAEAKAKAKLDSVIKSLSHAGSDFSSIARLNSDESNSASKGGEIGWLLEKQIQPEIRAKVATLKKGATTAPLRLLDGWHIVKVMEVKEGYTPPFEEVRAALAEKVRTERVKAATQAYLSQLIQENPVVINEIALSKLAADSKP